MARKIVFFVLLAVLVGLAFAPAVEANGSKGDVPISRDLVYRETEGKVVVYNLKTGLVSEIDSDFLSSLEDASLWYSTTATATTAFSERMMIRVNFVNGDVITCRVNFRLSQDWDYFSSRWVPEWQKCLMYPGSAAMPTVNASIRVGRMPIFLQEGDLVFAYINDKKTGLNCGKWVVLERPDCTIGK